MKNGREHRVPLSDPALEVLDAALELAGDDLVFPSPTGRALPQKTLSELMRALGVDAVPHGFRSSFRDWAAERTDAPREVCELALAHVNGDRVEAAYRRSDLFDRQRRLMADWPPTSPDAASIRRSRARGRQGAGVSRRRTLDAADAIIR